MEPDKFITAKYHVPALEKGLDILEKLAQASRPVSLTQLSQQLGRTNNEIYRMLNCLEERGYIFRDGNTGNYALSLRLYELALTHSPLEKLLAAAQRPMENLARKMNESCHLSVIDHDELLVLWQALTPGNVRISVQVGARFSAVNTVSGRMLIATMPSDKRLEFLASNRDYQQLSENEQNEMLLKLDEIHFQGVSYSENETIFGVKDYAVLVGNPRVGLAAALAITSMTSARSAKATKEIFFAMNECAATITKNAGMAIPTESI